jgi:glycosyltransferase involved in cell wall biosynthesis
MKVAFLATGAANMYCGSCMRDNTLVSAMKALGHQVSMLPMYTPLRVDEDSASEDYVFYSGIKTYILQQFPNRTPWRDALLNVAGAQTLTKLLTRFDIGSAVDPKANAELTISMLRGENGNQAILLEEMVNALSGTVRPQVVHITNTLISGPAREIKRVLNVPIVCGLHGEDIFLDGLPAPYRTQAIELIRQNAAGIDHFIATSQYYADMYGPLVGIPPEKISIVWPGIALSDYRNIGDQPKPIAGPLTIGYFARMAPEKGLHLLAEAFISLVKSGDFPGLRLKVAGYMSSAYAKYIDGVRERLKQAGVADQVDIIGTASRQQKLDFFRSIDVFSVPAVYPDPKGLPMLEALASGVPVVQPDHGAYPELIQATQGGLLHKPENHQDLAEKLAHLLRNAVMREEFRKQGRAAIHENFSAKRMAGDTVRVYESLTEQIATR